MADVSVRPARPADAEHVARVQLLTWSAAYADLLPTSVLELPLDQVAAMWLRAVELPPSPRHRLLVAMERDEVVGFAASTPTDDDDLGADIAELTALLVEPRWGRRGHGSRLLAATVQGWRDDGIAGAVAWAFEADLATRAFLAAAGWAPDGATRGLDTGGHVQRQLRFHTDLRITD